jgi:hypothetical protein
LLPLHAWQLAPAVPQAVSVFPSWQLFMLSQQPVGQEVALHWQVPATQTCPLTHCDPAPQWHIPPRQESDLVGSQGAIAPQRQAAPAQ